MELPLIGHCLALVMLLLRNPIPNQGVTCVRFLKVMALKPKTNEVFVTNPWLLNIRSENGPAFWFCF